VAGATTMNGILEIPVIDISRFRLGGPAERAAVAAEVDRAASDIGFIQVTGHRISDAVTAALTGSMDALFTLPPDAKLAWRPPTVLTNRGYTGPRSESLSYSLGVVSAKDLFEAFNVGAVVSPHAGRELPAQHYPDNVWPDVPGFRDAVEDWIDEAGRVARELTTIFAVALGLPDDYFEPLTDHSIDVLRMNNYQLPPEDIRIEPGQLGMGPHTDYGIVTVLWADPVIPGLQVLDTNGIWHDVVPASGALLVNLGDAVARWTNDRWISTMHRVLAPVDADGHVVHRRSAAYFHHGNADAVIACLPGCENGQEARYEPITVAEHLAAKLGGSRGGELNPSADREAARLNRAPQDVTA
jgi:isopenicillin N synthase-like dioxygenase